jgi:hypothetical protein
MDNASRITDHGSRITLLGPVITPDPLLVPLARLASLAPLAHGPVTCNWQPATGNSLSPW